MHTITTQPDLFKVSMPFDINRMKARLAAHPNPKFVQSVLEGLREGFWPWADTRTEGYPDTWDNSWAPPKTAAESDFVNGQRDIEHAVHHRLVSHHSAGPFCQNSMIDRTETAGPRMDTLHQFVPMLRAFKRRNPGKEAVLWKSDMAGAFRTLPMHPLWQIKQVMTSNLPLKINVQSTTRSSEHAIRNVDRRATFGSSGSPRLWASVMGLILWVAIHVLKLEFLCCYVNDSYSMDVEDNMAYYKPYDQIMPKKQVDLLRLWDFFGVPHERIKQTWGRVLTIIGFEINARALSPTLPAQPKADLVTALREFAASRQRRLHEFKEIAGWSNWSFNVFPLFKPGLASVYAKMAGKKNPHAGIYINRTVRDDLTWMADHIERSSGTFFFENIDWHPLNDADDIFFCDACLEGLGFWLKNSTCRFYASVPESHPMAERVFYWEAVCVLAALRWYARERVSNPSSRPRRLTILSDNTNTVAMFDTLRALPDYNWISKSTVDMLVEVGIDLRVVHVPGELNTVADAISRHDFASACAEIPNLTILPFSPPQSAGASSS
ncbi:hypothetical protein CYLTODRAFT_477608 [Cylindrobasidium torrendii FP15055 ss-10]|uniref:DNA/RNA polymerase n=1 Tax=Cylindrobasidium torrendii FP15055 ss-10 TaxID=1314674 RepID=A0A0D7AT73_9AGAR|nr:hypothetical protein CYLTODRAFT_477608 [Cylindrobasidium torrendii FP15055 ss-10]